MAPPSQIALLVALLLVVPTLASAQGGWPFRGLCENGKKDAGEVDVDCGGSCPLCGPGKTCKKNKDCQSNSCIQGTCALGVTCSNNIKDTIEADVDCGGINSGCISCCYGSTCSVNSDCQSGSCVDGKCEEAAFCASRFFEETFGGEPQLRTFGDKKALPHHQDFIKCGQCVCKPCPPPPSPPSPPPPPPSPPVIGA